MMLDIPVKIQEVMAIEGVVLAGSLHSPGIPGRIYAHVSTPVKDSGVEKQYVLLASFPRNGMTELGEIDSKSGQFKNFEPSVMASYVRSSNRVIYEMEMPASELGRLKTLTEFLATPGITIAGRNTPKLSLPAVQ